MPARLASTIKPNISDIVRTPDSNAGLERRDLLNGLEPDRQIVNHDDEEGERTTGVPRRECDATTLEDGARYRSCPWCIYLNNHETYG